MIRLVQEDVKARPLRDDGRPAEGAVVSLVRQIYLAATVRTLDPPRPLREALCEPTTVTEVASACVLQPSRDPVDAQQ